MLRCHSICDQWWNFSYDKTGDKQCLLNKAHFKITAHCTVCTGEKGWFQLDLKSSSFLGHFSLDLSLLPLVTEIATNTVCSWTMTCYDSVRRSSNCIRLGSCCILCQLVPLSWCLNCIRLGSRCILCQLVPLELVTLFVALISTLSSLCIPDLDVLMFLFPPTFSKDIATILSNIFNFSDTTCPDLNGWSNKQKPKL